MVLEINLRARTKLSKKSKLGAHRQKMFKGRGDWFLRNRNPASTSDHLGARHQTLGSLVEGFSSWTLKFYVTIVLLVLPKRDQKNIKIVISSNSIICS